ncbi:LLM class flavin-dependent oxidoreductase [Arthrobacter crystallopoietes]|uniref:Luciferase family oxidoreductase, group 1 n=1 Tax=Crystallibacter crystallopoietes TaxID=37928 RepID=A0A1H1BCP4_9MICC|nr:LLM class flavin-dependent oxidoreductase [Arthrobacter crystallopoietes]AUI51190.1 flavin monooxygenase [Arthrobacter crystallopoietes]SDQ49692.1 luciferase family oxidoreductase, group 1 [Arthrobacter crystallopoietes]
MTGVPLTKIPVSILDRANSRSGGTEAQALSATANRARRAEELGYHRFWVAEHHSVPGIAGSAPTVLMGIIAARTERIRVGSGGVMLPNHQPLVVAEQIATLQALFPGRIDLGVGRSVGFTPAVRQALRQDKDGADRFETDLAELLEFLTGEAAITTRPYDGGATPPFVLATGQGADIAARAGLAVVVGGPAYTGRMGMPTALARYRRNFRPSRWYPEPYVIVSANVAVAATAGQARELLLPEAWALAQSRTRGEFPPLEPVESVRWGQLTGRQQKLIDESLASSIYGSPEDVAEQLARLLDATGANEFMVTGNTFDPAALADSDARLAELMGLHSRSPA